MVSKRRCVVKQLKPATTDPVAYQIIKERFHREAAILEKLGKASNQIPTLYDYFTEAKEFYLVQDWVEGENLAQRIRRAGKFSAQEAQALLASLLPVLEEIHSQGVIHRDIKPENIMLRAQDGKPILIDFGAVKEIVSTIVDSDGDSSLTIVIGTPEFMPQEQTIGKPVFASDLYSLGLTAVFSLTGKRPSELPTDHQGKILWRQHASNVPSRLAAVIDRAIMPAARDRYKTAGEMYRAIVPAERKSGPGLPTYAVILLMFLLVGGAGIIAYQRAREAREAQGKAEQEAQAAQESRRRAEQEAQKRIEQERAAREAAEAKQRELEKYKPGGQIRAVWVEHNVYDSQRKGMRIHVKFEVTNYQNVKCGAAVYFYYSSGEALKDLNNRYRTPDGKVAYGVEFTPANPASVFEDFKIFMPYDELHMGVGEARLKFKVQLYRVGGEFFATSGFTEFNISKTK